MAYKTLSIDLDSCTGCRSCMVACSFRNEGVFSSRQSRIWIPKSESECLSVPIICEQCDPAPCMVVCPTKAITRTSKTNAVVVLTDKCILCKECMWACPFGAINIHHGSATKCELCNGSPACVSACRYGAIKFLEPHKVGTTKNWRAAERLRQRTCCAP